MFASCVAERERGSHAEPFGLRALWRAYKVCRKGKRAARDTQGYEARLLDKLVSSRDALSQGRWRPSRTFSFVVSHPKAREIHASPFADRVVHHVIANRLARLYEPVFIYDSYANRVGKGTHAAVDRLQVFMRQASHGGARPAYALQLDIANFFNSIHRPTLFRLLQGRLQRDVRAGKLGSDEASSLQTLCRVLLEGDPTLGVRQRGHASHFALVPPHKRLGAVGPTSGLPIGNLTSQFFANVYLNELDQFVKHQLKCRWYVRYVDDFVLLHSDPAQLLAWRDQIVAFLAERLSLRLKALADPHPLNQGTDFLGYVVRPGYRLARRRVVRRMQVVLQAFERQHVRGTSRGLGLDLPVSARELLRAQLASFCTHLSHAQSIRLWLRVQRRHAWLGQLFYLHANPALGLQPRWACAVPPGNLIEQYTALRQRASAIVARAGAATPTRLLMQVGRCWMLPGPSLSGLPAGLPTQRPGLGPCTEWPLTALPALRRGLQRLGLPHAVAEQTGHYATGFKRRTLTAWWAPLAVIKFAPTPMTTPMPVPLSQPISNPSNLGDSACL